jgi:hypothetical protein
MKFNKLVFALLFFAGTSALAAMGGDEKGNGGLTTLCEVNGQKVYEVYDLFEARSFYRLNLKFAEGENYLEVLKNTIARLDRVNPSRANLYREYLSQFAMEANFVENSNLLPTPDIGSGPRPEGCTLAQAVIQFRQPGITGIRYYIDKNIWAQLNDSNKAALVLHELIYREGLKAENNFTTSIGVRYLNGILHSDLMETMTLRKYIEEVLGYNSFVDADANGVRIRLHTANSPGKAQPLQIEYWDDNTARKASLGKVFNVTVPGQKTINYICDILPGRETSHAVYFHPNGGVKRMDLQCRNKLGIALNYKEASGGLFADALYYDEQGLVKKIETVSRDEEVPMVFNYHTENFNFIRSLGQNSADLLVEFDKEGSISFLCFGMEKQIQNNWFTKSGKISYIKDLFKDQRVSSFGVYFDKDQLVKITPEECSVGMIK